MKRERQRLCRGVVVPALIALLPVAHAADEYGFEDGTAAPPADYTNHVEIGIGFTDDGDGKFGEYGSGLNGALQSDGPFGFGSLRWGASDPASAQYWRIDADTQQGRLLDAAWGVQGDFALGIRGDRVEKIEYGDARHPYPASGATLSLPAGFVPGTSIRDEAWYAGHNIASTREVLGVDGVKHLGEHWTLRLDFESQSKEGEDTLGGNQGFYGVVLLPETLDHRTDLATVRLDYADERLHSTFELHLSEFDNGARRLAYRNAQYAGSLPARPLGLAEFDTGPDNELLRLSTDGGYLLDGGTRLAWFVDWSRGEQDEQLLPLHIDPVYHPTVNPDSPVDSLDGEVERRSLRLSLAGRPFARFDYRLEIDYRDRESGHDPYALPMLSYTGTASGGYSSHVYERETRGFSLEGGYRFPNRARLRGGYEREAVDRGSEAFDPLGHLESYTDATDDDRYWLELKLPRFGALSLALRAEYLLTDPSLSDETLEFIAPGGGQRRATPFFLLERSRDVYALDLDYELGHATALYGSFEVVREDFDNETYGLHSRDARVADLGVSWSPASTLSVSAYLGREEYEIRQTGRQMGGTSVPYSEWLLVSDDDARSLGVNLEWEAIEGRLDLEAEFALLDTQSGYASSEIRNAGIALLTGPTPDVDDELLRLRLGGTWRLSERLDISGRYLWERRDARDWAWDTLLSPAAATTASSLGFAWARPDYDAQVLMMALRYRF